MLSLSSLNAYEHVYIHGYTHICICIHIYIHIYIYIYTYTYIHIHIHTCIYFHISLFSLVHMHIHIHSSCVHPVVMAREARRHWKRGELIYNPYILLLLPDFLGISLLFYLTSRKGQRGITIPTINDNTVGKRRRQQGFPRSHFQLF